MNKPTRREFLRIAGLMGGASLFAGCHLLEGPTPVPEYIEGAPAVDPLETLEGIRNLQTVCGLCPGNCGIRCRVAQGILVKIGGNPFHPICTNDPLPFGTPLEKSLLNGGSVCAIGGSGIQTLYNRFRIARPLKRVGPRGSGKWKALTWEQALREIVVGGDLFGEGPVKGLKDLKQEGSGLAVLAGATDWGSRVFLKGFVGAFPGAVMLQDQAAIMREKARIAADAVFGAGTGAVDADYRHARFVMSFGDAPLDSGVPLVSLARNIADSRVGGTGFKWAVAEPRLSTTASKADVWMPVIPGKDMDLALGIMRAIADYHPDAARFPDEGLKKGVMARSLDDYGNSCGVDVEAIKRVARFLVEEGPRAAAIPGRGVLRHADGVETAKAILTLNVMVGSIPGSGGLVKRDDRFLADAEKKLPGRVTGEPAVKAYGDAVKAMIVWQADPVYEDRASAVFFADRTKVPLFVAIDTEITETSSLADFILPDTTYLERWDICISPPSVAEPGIGVRSPVVGAFDAGSGRYVPAVPDSRVMEEILFHLAADLELDGFKRDESGRVKTAWDFYRQALEAVLESMKGAGFPITGSKEDIERVIERGGLFSIQTMASRPGPAEKKAGYIPPVIPVSSDMGSVPKEGLMLFTYSLPFHRSPASGLNSWLLEVLPENLVVMNSDDARALGIKNLSMVVLESLDVKTRVECKAQVIPGIRPGTVAVAGGFGYTQSGARAQAIAGINLAADRTKGAGFNPGIFMDAKGAARVRVKKSNQS